MRSWLGLTVILSLGCRAGRETEAAPAVSTPSTGSFETSAPPTTAPERISAPSARAVARKPDIIGAQLLLWEFEQEPFGRTPVLVHVPRHHRAERVPVLLTYHGRGEALKPPLEGVRGWWQDYGLERAVERVSKPPLTQEDYQGWVDRTRLDEVNRGLTAQPYAGLILVMPFLHDVLKGTELLSHGPHLVRFVKERLVPAVRDRLKTLEVGPWGVDGVSLGGRAALWIGLSLPEQFSIVGATQAALDLEELDTVVQLARRVRERQPGLLLRLVTSDEDYYRDVVEELAARLKQTAVSVDLARLRGKHGYRFNRGPGAFEMLLYYDRQLRERDLP